MVSPFDSQWTSDSFVTAAQLNRVTLGTGTQAERLAIVTNGVPWQLDRLFFDLTERKLYINVGTVAAVEWTALIAGGGAFGSGADGAKTVSSNETITSGIKQYTTLTIDEGFALTLTDRHTIILASDGLIVNGTLNGNGRGGDSGDGSAGGGGTSGDSNGAAGSNVNPTTQIVSVKGKVPNGVGSTGRQGGNGGAGGAGGSIRGGPPQDGKIGGGGGSSGGSVTANTVPFVEGDFRFLPRIYNNEFAYGSGGAGSGGAGAGGRGGRGENSNTGSNNSRGGDGGSGASGGRGGGSLLILTPNLIIGTNGLVDCSGGNGEDGGDGQDGGDGFRASSGGVNSTNGGGAGGGGQGAGGAGGNGGLLVIVHSGGNDFETDPKVLVNGGAGGFGGADGGGGDGQSTGTGGAGGTNGTEQNVSGSAGTKINLGV